MASATGTASATPSPGTVELSLLPDIPKQRILGKDELSTLVQYDEVDLIGAGAYGHVYRGMPLTVADANATAVA
jgi:hypothetical protein